MTRARAHLMSTGMNFNIKKRGKIYCTYQFIIVFAAGAVSQLNINVVVFMFETKKSPTSASGVHSTTVGWCTRPCVMVTVVAAVLSVAAPPLLGPVCRLCCPIVVTSKAQGPSLRPTMLRRILILCGFQLPHYLAIGLVF